MDIALNKQHQKLFLCNLACSFACLLVDGVLFLLLLLCFFGSVRFAFAFFFLLIVCRFFRLDLLLLNSIHHVCGFLRLRLFGFAVSLPLHSLTHSHPFTQCVCVYPSIWCLFFCRFFKLFVLVFDLCSGN